MDINKVGLYLLKNVRITLSGGEKKSGRLNNILSAEGNVRLDEEDIAMAEILDIEFVGKISDFHTYKGVGEIEGITFTLDDLSEDLDRDTILYGEFDCIAACHLEFAGARIEAKDVSLISCTHRVYVPELSEKHYWYRMRDGRVYTGKLERSGDGFALELIGGEKEDLNLSEVADITRKPVVNDYIYVALKDQSIVSGVVSGITEDMLVLIGDTVAMVEVKNIRTVRYRGTIAVGTANTAKGPVRQIRVSVDGSKTSGTFLCKEPYFEDEGMYENLSGGEVVSFIPGVSEKGLIAKHVKIEESVSEEASTGASYRGKGVILFLQNNANGKTSGYIGREYLAKGYAYLTKREMPKGIVQFTGEQLNFECKPGNIYVVDYECVQDPSISVQKALSVELDRAVPYAECAQIKITENNEVEILPFSVAYLPRFVQCDVELTLTSGIVVRGYLEEYRDSCAVILNSDAEDFARETYHQRDILKARYCGVITSYRPDNGTGYLSGEYWFHINNLRDYRDVQKVKLGAGVVFTVEQTHKGKFCAAADVSIINEEPKRGMLTAYDGVTCCVSSREAYENDEEAKSYRLIATRRVVEEKLGELNLTAYDYPIVYSLRKSGLESRVSISHIDTMNRVQKPAQGYVLKYVKRPNNVSFGFILEPSELQDHLNNNDRTGTIYFRDSDIKNPSEFALNTQTHYYRVAYAKGENRTAKSVRILGEYEFPEKASAPAEQAKAAASRPDVPESIDLEQYMTSPAEEYSGAQAAFGLVNLCSSHYALINSCYINQKLLQDELYSETELAVMFDPSRTRFLGDSNLKTGKYSYLVRYVTKGTATNTKTGAEHPAIDYDYPVEVLQAIPKMGCRRISIEGNKVVIEQNLNYMQKKSGEQGDNSNRTFDMPDMIPGENVVFQMKDGAMGYYTFQGEEEGYYIVGDDIRIAQDSVEKVFRFGVVTDFDMEKAIATLNRILDVPLGIVDVKVINILKSQSNGIRLHVMYACVNNQVIEVNRISEECSRLIRWEEGVVSGYDAGKKRVTVGENIRHYVSVLSDGLINRACKTGTITGKEVYAKVVSHLFFSTETQEILLSSSAIELRMRTETATIRYDAGLDLYRGYRNPTFFYPVSGSLAELEKYIDQETEITFAPGEDGCSLCARIDDLSEEGEDDVSEEIENFSLKSVTDEKLVLFCMDQVDLGQMFLKGVSLNEDGMPADSEQAQKAFDILRGQPGDAALFAAAAVAQRFPEVVLEKNKNESDGLERNSQIARMMISGVQKRCRKTGLDVNGVSGEHAYYVSFLLRYPLRRNWRRGGSQYSVNDCLVQLFMQDFGTREDLGNYLQKGVTASRRQLNDLLEKKCKQNNELLPHLILLDQKSLEVMCNTLEGYEALAAEIKGDAAQIEEYSQSASLLEIVQAVREKYKRDKSRFSAKIKAILESTEIISEMREVLINMQARFLKMICADDAYRFERLLKACTVVCDYSNRPGFAQQEDALKYAYREVCEIEQEIRQHPCRESAEILFMAADENTGDSLFGKLKREIEALLNDLYSDAAALPQLLCMPNEPTLEKEQKSFWLIIRNGSSDQKLQTAENITVFLESYTEGVSVDKRIDVKQKHLAAGDQMALEVSIVYDAVEKEAVTIGWSVEYEYASAFSGGATVKERRSVDVGSYFELQFGADSWLDKSIRHENPYSAPAYGRPLEDATMFFGREAESREIRDSIIRVVDGKETFISGSAVIIHGQKKSGKTSLVYQIKNYIKEDPFLEKTAIILNFNNILDEIGGVELLSCFKRNFYASILYRFEDEIYDNHPEVEKLLEEQELEIPDLFDPANREVWAAQFDCFFREFFRLDNGKHTIVLFMDEFTQLCTTIMSEIDRDPSQRAFASIPTFIKTFSMYGFVQVIIGHEAMMRAFDELGVLNHTAEFAKSIEIGALDREASVKLITEPMEKAFGFNPYGTELGSRAVERILDLSGRNPTYLMRLCDRMFDYYQSDRCTHTQLLAGDVEAMLEEFVNDLLMTDFDILMIEDGDDPGDPEQRDTYQFLKSAAFLAADSFDGRTADNNEISRKLFEEYGWRDERIEKIRNRLEARRVISITSGGRVKINTGLFLEYILRKSGR
ncbi:MAG: ATP-binding protein [Eubacteriales bacterium]|nr:ATP-binding protein [Eubacteriales bacterium]